MKTAEIFFAFVLVVLMYYRGYLVHNFIRNKQGNASIKFGVFYEELLNRFWWGGLLIVIPFYSKVENPEIISKQKKINYFTYLFYLTLALAIFVSYKFPS